MECIVNATGTDRIVLWTLRNGKISRKSFSMSSWIFVTGDPFDLDFLSRQLDISPFGYEWTSRSDVYGEIKGIDISVKPSRIRYLINSVEKAGLGRKFRVFNGDLDAPMRFMSERELEFFHLNSPYDDDSDMNVLSVDGRMKAGGLDSIVIDGESYRVGNAVMKDLEGAIRSSDVIVYNNRGEVFRSILYMMRSHGASLPTVRTRSGSTYQSYGQIHYNSPTVSISGKICIPSDSFVYSEAGISGIYEMSRTSSLPPTTAAIVTPGTAVSTMEESMALRKNILIPLYKDDHEVEKSLDDLISTDRGGIALQPDPGLYEDVYEIDFSSMYPSIIVRYNLSPETIGQEGSYKVPDTPYSVDTSRKGFLPYALESLLEKRLFYKSIRERKEVYRKRDTALKWMLLTSFGYTGYKNAKFGKIEAHESITSIGRHVLSTAMKLAESMGFRVIHGIVDSLWIKGSGDVHELMRRIKNETLIDIVLDGHYRWIAFLPARTGLGSLNRYIGMRTDGTYKIRGIEMRRSDVPELSRKFQLEALTLFEDCMTVSETGEKYQDLVDLERMYLENLRNFPREDFRINMKITRRPEEYRVRNLQKITLEKLRRRSVEVNPGERIPIIVTDRGREVVDLEDDYDDVDLDFYRRQLYRAFECFDFIVERSMGSRKTKVMRLTDPAFRS